MTQLTKEHLDKALDTQTKELKTDLKAGIAQVAGQVEDLAGMVQRRFDDLEMKLDVRVRVEKVEQDVRVIKQALHITK